jgi:hypothetical protein
MGQKRYTAEQIIGKLTAGGSSGRRGLTARGFLPD